MRKNKNVKKKCIHNFKNYETDTYIFKHCKKCHHTVKIKKQEKK
jgi:hypothetical protein